MEVLTTGISFVLLAGLITSPILILAELNKQNMKYKFLVFLVLGIIITSSLTLLFGWWLDTSNEIPLSHYGYDLEAWNDKKRFEKVASENFERVKRLEISMMGIGWPLKAFVFYVFYLTYLLIIYLGIFLFRKLNKEHTPNKVQ